MKNIGVQLYTVRDMLNTDIDAQLTINQIKEIGYTSVQLFGSGELIERCAKCCRKANLDILGVLTNITECVEHEVELFEICKKYNIPDIGISSSYEECENPIEYIKKVNTFAKKSNDAGFSFSYHNHGHEFIKLSDGQTAMQHFIVGFDLDTVNFMPDTYWIQDGGYDIRYFLEQVKNRIKTVHLKDMKRTTDGHIFTEVGNGNLYIDGIIKTALDYGAKHFVVEQDICEGNPIDSLKKSYEYLNKI